MLCVSTSAFISVHLSVIATLDLLEHAPRNAKLLGDNDLEIILLVNVMNEMCCKLSLPGVKT